MYEFTFYFVKIKEVLYITLKLYRYYGKNTNKFLTKFKRIVDKCDEIVIIYWYCFDLDRSSGDSGSANNSHYLNLTHPLCSLSPLSRCFLASNTIKSKVQKQTRYEPDHRVLFYYVKNIAVWYFRNHDKGPLQSSAHGCTPCSHRNLRFRAAHFCPLFRHHTISSSVSCRKTLFVTDFLKKINQSIFPLNW